MTSCPPFRTSAHRRCFTGAGQWPGSVAAVTSQRRYRYNRTARPFNWEFSADDLTALLRRISQREQSAAGQQATLSQAA